MPTGIAKTSRPMVSTIPLIQVLTRRRSFWIKRWIAFRLGACQSSQLEAARHKWRQVRSRFDSKLTRAEKTPRSRRKAQLRNAVINHPATSMSGRSQKFHRPARFVNHQPKVAKTVSLKSRMKHLALQSSATRVQSTSAHSNSKTSFTK